MYLKRTIGKDLTQFRSQDFPWRTEKDCPTYRHAVLIGVGGNMGDVKRRFSHLLHFLRRQKKIRVCQTSSILKNPPFGYLDQPFFHNAVIAVKTSMQPYELLAYLQHIEKRFGRVRSFKDAPRTLDLDILFFDNREIQSRDLVIPHKEWYKRKSVLIPMMEVDMGTSKNPKLSQHYRKSAYARRNFAVATGSFKKFQRRRSAFSLMPYGSTKEEQSCKKIFSTVATVTLTQMFFTVSPLFWALSQFRVSGGAHI